MKTAILLAIMAATAPAAYAAPAAAGAELEAALQKQADVIDRKIQRTLDAAMENSVPVATPEQEQSGRPHARGSAQRGEPLRLAENLAH